MRYWNSMLGVVFALLVLFIAIVGQKYIADERNALLVQQYETISKTTLQKLNTHIQTKKNATLSIAISLSLNPQFQQMFEQKKVTSNIFELLSKNLQSDTDFKNVWVQLIDANGFVIARNWDKAQEENLLAVRSDLASFLASKKAQTSVSVGRHDLSIKAMIPYFDDKHRYLGHLEVITHFNSIAKKMEAEGFQTLVLADKKYKKQLTKPFTKQFIEDYYVANSEASKSILEYVRSFGVKHFINYKQNYDVDRANNYLIVNTTLLDNKELPMAYVLMFQKLSDVNVTQIKSEELFNYFIMFVIVAISAFILLLLINRSPQREEYKSWKRVVLFMLLFLTLSGILWTALNGYEKEEQKQFLKSHENVVQKDYELIQNKYTTLAGALFATVINKPQVLELMQEAYSADKNSARSKLYALLKSEYEQFKTYDMRQLHFHLRNNESFLRFHRPQLFGDNLSGVRKTVEWVNAHHEAVSGFEEGRVYNGFRHVFPLQTLDATKEHLGSVEISFSAHAFAKEFALTHNAKAGFLVSKKAVDSKVFAHEKGNYEATIFSSFYDERAIKKQLEHTFIAFDETKLSATQREFANSEIHKGEPFSVVGVDEVTLLTFLPLKNAITKEVVGCIILQEEDDYLKKESKNFSLLFFVGSTLIFFILLYIFKENQQKIVFKNHLLKTQGILDTQETIIVVTDGKKIHDVNKKFLEFFNFSSLQEFKEFYNCICDKFIEKEGYFSTSLVPKGETWIEYLAHSASKDHIVLIGDEQGIAHSFAIHYSKYEQNSFIVTFNDISEKMYEHFALEDKVLHDKLTGAYNREFFEIHIVKLQADVKNGKNALALIMFDIDHFKSINDTYGHDVGDYVLIELVACVNASLRSDDVLVRWGGEEFFVLLSVSSIELAYRIAQNLRNVVAKHHFEGLEQLTCSFGVTLCGADEKISDAVKRVDNALYVSKENGRNRVTLS